jgi:hypothetical protein
VTEVKENITKRLIVPQSLWHPGKCSGNEFLGFF